MNAKQLLDISDAVLGTGRGFMEASSKSKIMLAPIKSSSFPLLINEENFKEAFNYNFSERLTISNFDESENYHDIKEIITTSTLKQRKSELAIKLFNEFFDSNRINTKYAAVFSKMKKNNKKAYFDLFLRSKEAFNYNFSERLTISNFDESENYHDIKEIITTSTLKQRKSELAIKLFNEFFDSNRINTKYAAVFSKMKKNNKKAYFDLFLHFLFVIRAFLKQ